MTIDPQWADGAPSFTLTVTPEDATALMRGAMTAAMAAEDNSTQRLRLALALAWITWKVEQ